MVEGTRGSCNEELKTYSCGEKKVYTVNGKINKIPK